MSDDAPPPTLNRSFPLRQELPLIHKLLCGQFSELPQALEDDSLRARLADLINRLIATPATGQLSTLLHPALADWHYTFAEQARLSLADGNVLDERGLVESLEAVTTSLESGEVMESRTVPGTPFRTTSTTGWARRSIESTKGAEVKPIEIVPDGAHRPRSKREMVFAKDLVGACKILEEVWPEAWEEIKTTVRYVVPFDGHAHDSFTSPSTLGALYVCPRLGEPASLGEILVHEARHNRLLMLQRRISLYENDDVCRYWSPWRQTERPFRGILHGTFAFIGVCHYHGRLLRKGYPVTPLTLRRLMEECDRVFSMLKLLSAHGRWTSEGRKVFDELQDEAIDMFPHRDFLVQRLCPDHAAVPYKKEQVRELIAAAATAGDHQGS